MGKAVPDRWRDYQPLGQCISGTRIVAFKVPLKMNVCRLRLPENEWFTPSILLEKQPQLKTVIDLTNTYRYYDGQSEFRTKGIDHVKILVEGKGTIPPDSQLQRFFEAVDHHMEKYADMSDALIGVHCTHGLNRTGYFICKWMVDRLNMDPDDAIERFNQARGHKIERKPLLDSIRLRNLPKLLSASSQSNESYSPLNDPSYDEPYRSRSYQYRGNPRKQRNRRKRGERNEPFEKTSSHSYSSRPEGQSDHQKSSIRENRNKPTRADLDTNWRARDDSKTRDEERQKNFGSKEWRQRWNGSRGNRRGESSRRAP